MWSLLSVALLSCLAPASPRPQTPFFDFQSFIVPASRFNSQPVRQELKTFSASVTNNQQFSSFAPAPVKPEVSQEFVSFSPIKPDEQEELIIKPEDDEELVSFAPVKSEDDPEITRFSPIPIEEEKKGPVLGPMLLPLTIEDGKPMTDVFSIAGPPYSEPDEEMMDTVKMVPFVNLGESSPVTEVEEQSDELELMVEKLTKEEMVTDPQSDELELMAEKLTKEEMVTVTDPPEQPTNEEAMSDMMKPINPEVSEKLSSPMTKHTLIQMAVDRLKDMEEKKEVMEIMKNLKDDNLYVLQPVVEGDIIKVSDHPTMDGMNIIEFKV